jgi:molybdopterin-containing oxidoreductase family iron-sulfur binding subunit
MADLNRRDFLKVLGVGGAATATGCSDSNLRWDPMVPIENVLPYVVQPEHIVPGLSTWYASRCDQCSSGCGIVVKTREGRVINVEGNPHHPTNQGTLCTWGKLGLQAPYSPDRYEGPLRNNEPLDWQEAAGQAADAVNSARTNGKQIAWLGSPRTGASAAIIDQFAVATDGQVLHWDPLADDALKAAVKAVFGRDDLPRYVMDEAHTVVSFGADYLHSWGLAVEHSTGWANSRNPEVGGFVSRTVCIEPRVGATSAMADLMLQVKPGTEVAIAMALAKLVADETDYSGPAKALLQGIDPDAAATEAGINGERLYEVAKWMGEHASIVLPGGTTTSASPTDLAIATLLINEVAGNIGKTVVFGADVRTSKMGSYQDVVALIEDCRAGKVGVLFIDDVDPVYNLPSSLNVSEALAKVDQLIIFANEPTDTISTSALVLPPGTGLERWGDSEAILGRYTIQQPGMRPLKDTRSSEDVVLAISQLLGMMAPAPAAAAASSDEASSTEDAPAEGEAVEAAPAAAVVPNLDAASFKDYVASWWKAVVYPQSGESHSFGRFWTESLQRGGYFIELANTGAPVTLSTAPDTTPLALTGSGDLDLLLFPHIHMGVGKQANRPWSQEIPDGLTGFTWGTWLEVHPDTAAKLGLDKDKSAILKTDHGEIEVGWFGSPGMRTDAVAVVMGNGHESGGRYAGYGANPMKIIESLIDEKSGGLRLTTTKASVSSGESQNTPSVAGAIDTQGRPSINHVVSIDDLGTGHGPESIVPLHHPPVPERLKAQMDTIDMYPEPNHPTYRFAMAIDLNTCTGCGACQAACYAENNNSIVGPDQIRLGRTMSWIRLSRYWEGEGEHPDVRFQPVMCQQCSHAPCEGVCPVLATYHNLDGLNAMIYNRCVGTRYCANNCPWTARRFNYHTYRWPDSFNLMLNPDVLVREMGVMEKCTFCIQRIREVKDAWRDVNKLGLAPDEALQKLPTCAQSCPAGCITFGNLKDPESLVSQTFQNERAYTMLGELNAKPGVRYLARINHIPSGLHHGGGHGDGHGGDHGDGHGDGHEASHGDAHGDDGHGDSHGDAGHGDGHGGEDHGGAAGDDHHGSNEHGAENAGHH